MEAKDAFGNIVRVGTKVFYSPPPQRRPGPIVYTVQHILNEGILAVVDRSGGNIITCYDRDSNQVRTLRLGPYGLKAPRFEGTELSWQRGFNKVYGARRGRAGMVNKHRFQCEVPYSRK